MQLLAGTDGILPATQQGVASIKQQIQAPYAIKSNAEPLTCQLLSTVGQDAGADWLLQQGVETMYVIAIICQNFSG